MNFADMQQDVIDIRFKEADRNRIKRWINLRYGQLWGAADWSFKHTAPLSFTVTQADDTPTMPADFGKITQVFDDQGNELVYRSPWEFEAIDQQYVYQGRTGRSQGYTVIADQVILAPTPNVGATFKIRYERRVCVLSSGNVTNGLLTNASDEPVWDEAYHYLLVVGALATGMKLVNDPNASAIEAEFSQGFAVMEDDLAGVQGAVNLQYGRDTLGDDFWGEMPTRVIRNRYYRFTNADFSGGLNLRDAPSELAANETPDCMNVTLDQRGGLQKRQGLTKLNSSQFNSTTFDNMFYSPTLQILIAQQQRKLAKSTDGGVTWTELQTNAAATPCFTDSNRVGFCEYLGKIIIAHPGATDGGVYSYDNTTAKISAKVTNSPKASMCTTWQNRLFTAGDTAAPTTVTNSDAGALTYTTLATTYNANPFRTKDDAPVTAIGGGEGIDIAGRSGLLVFKEESTYRINNSTSIAYDLISHDYGCSSPLGLASVGGVTGAISKKGILAVSDTTAVLVSGNLTPLFSPIQLALANTSNMCGGVYRDRMVFSLTRIGKSTNDLTLEYNPSVGWIVPHEFGLSCYATYGKQDQKLIGGHVSSGYAYEVFKGVTDDGATITARYQTPWHQPFGGDAFRLHRVRVSGRGSFKMYVKYDYTLGAGDEFQIAFAGGTAGVWGTGVWGTATWGPNLSEDTVDINPSGHGTTVSFQFIENSTTAVSNPPLLSTGGQDPVGSFAVYRLQSRIWPLEGV